jgi:Uma2 family endonuclease
MIRLRTPPITGPTLADLLRRLGNISPQRVRLYPPPGTATENDVIAMEASENRLFELVDGVLVEKVMGQYESRIAAVLIFFLEQFLSKHNLGIVYGADATLRLMPDLVRIPDVSFIRWSKLPRRELPAEPIPDLVPDLAVEIVSAGNTAEEMRRKISEYFEAGVRIVWLIDPALQSAVVYTAVHKYRRINEAQALKGGTVLPGFSLTLRDLFTRAGKRRG